MATGDIQSCWPTATTTEKETLLNGRGLYSPGTICPVGYTTACASRSRPASLASRAHVCHYPTFDFQFEEEEGETMVGCCPTGYNCIRDMFGRQSCLGVVSSTSVNVVTCQSDGSTANATQVAVPWSSSGTFRSGISLSAPLIQLAWKSSDVTGEIDATAGCASNDSNTDTDDGLSKSASVAVAVIIPIVVLGSVIAFLVWALHKRKMQLARAVNQPMMLMEQRSGPQVQQLDAHEVLELEGTPRPAEKPANAGYRGD
ncbi:hypothetical protein HDK90DRAFT_163140 [Phyllosticta capitalensis]|uniref:Uncharacterized protein n=1 Tax=Phyllosticta capitalensis TaxID=121624 RepID=A0ABR1Z0T7_9PEZI